jgi:hypothetical protein
MEECSITLLCNNCDQTIELEEVNEEDLLDIIENIVCSICEDRKNIN